MATTAYGVNHPQAVKHWSGDIYKEVLKKTYASRFMGMGSGALCQVRNEMKSEGDRVRVGLRMQLTGAGIDGDGTLEGQEEALAIYHDDIFIDQLRHAVRSAGKMSEQRVPFSVRAEARDGLADWWADRYDYAFFNQLTGNTAETDTKKTGMQSAIAPSSGNTILVTSGGTAITSTASVDSTSVFSVAHIDFAVEKATEATYPFRPLKMNGSDYFVQFVHTYQATDMRRAYTAGEWGDIQKAALSGGNLTKNPVFTGAMGVYNNVIIHSSSRLPAPTTTTRNAVFCGAQAAAVAWGKGNSFGNKYSWVEELFDYENQLGVAAGCIFGLKKMVYNSVDFATMVTTTYAAAHA